MSLLDRFTRTPQRSLTAAAKRVPLNERTEATRIRRSNAEWQNDAWAYRDSIGEVRTAVGFLRNTARRIRLIPGWVPADGGAPIPLEDAVAKGEEPLATDAVLAYARDVLDRLSGDTGSHGDLLEPMAENMEVPGEGWIVGFQDELGAERWEFRSIDEVHTDAAGSVHLIDDIATGGTGSVTGQVLQDDAWLVRVWQPHPRYRGQAESPMRSLLNPCEELLLAERRIRATDRSRLAGAGLFLIPEEADVIGAEVDPESGAKDDLMTTVTKAAVATLSTEGDARSVVPIFAKVPAETIGKFQHLTFDRPLDEKLIDRMQQAIRRLAQGLDVPPEIVLGLADVNHWTAWQIDEGAFKNHVAPLFERMTDGLTAGVFRPMLSEVYGVSDEVVRRCVVWYDPDAVTSKPNRAQDAKDAHGALALSDERYLEALGFDPEADAPDPEEIARRIAQTRGAIDPIMMDWMVAKHLDARYPGLRVVPAGQISVGVDERAQEVEAENPPASVAVVPGEVAPEPPEETPEPPAETPSQDSVPPVEGPPPAAQTASAAPERTRTTSRRLVAIERSLRDRVQAAADEAVFRALERSGNRLRSRANKSADLRAAVDGVPAHLVASTLGAARSAALVSDSEILETAWTRLEAQYKDWTRSAAREALREAARVAGRTLTDDEIEAGLEKLMPDVNAGWAFLAAGLTDVAGRALFTAPTDDGRGEASNSHYVDASLVRGSLTVAGGQLLTAEGVTAEGVSALPGSPVPGLTGGAWLSEFMVASGVGTVGYEWVYGISRRNFTPHLNLDGVVFANYGDPELANPLGWPASTCAPGDHKGCHCDAAPIYETGQNLSVTQQAVGDATNDGSVLQVNREIAAQDEAAGRYGWPSTTPIDVVTEADRVANRRPSQQ